MSKAKFLAALATCAAIGAGFTGVADAQTVGTMDIYNGTSGGIIISPGDVSTTNSFDVTSSLPVVIPSGATQNAVSISGPTKTSVTLSVKVTSQQHVGYGCNFQVIFVYQYSMNDINYYYPNTSALPFYPTGATTIPTCYAEPGGPTFPIDSFYEYFSIKGI